MNLVEKLKNVPEGTKMYSPLFRDPVTFIRINKGALYPIICKTIVGELFELNQEGYGTVASAPQNCMLFPTPEMTWDGYEYIPEGSLVICKRDNKITQIACSKGEWCNNNCSHPYWWYDFEKNKLCDYAKCLFWYNAIPTLEEIATIDNLLNEKGYLFKNKKLEKIQSFKKGDIIASERTISIVDHIANLGAAKNVIYYQACINASGRLIMGIDCGVGKTKDNHYATNGEKARILRMLNEAGYEFDGVNVKYKEYKFKPFEQVLVRDYFNEKWSTAYYSHKDGPTHVAHGRWVQCIPYIEETKHLVGTTKKAPKKYITWDRV